MSRHHLRTEKNCLNCGAVVEDRYCPHCGQENVEPQESLLHLIGHFFADITHFDSKIFITLKDLIWRPGFLTREYAEGRRMRYLNPIRMYVFISAIFFLVLYAGKDEGMGQADIQGHAVNLFRQQFADSLREAAGAAGAGGAVRAAGSAGVADSVRRMAYGEVAARLDTAAVKPGEQSLALHMSSNGKVVVDLVENKYHTLAEYDSVQAKLPDSSRDHGMTRWMLRNNVRLKEEHGERNVLRLETNVQHTIPKLMFILLPLFALYVSWFYGRKRYDYSHYAIFSIHFHCFYFLIMLVAILAGDLTDSVWVSLGLPGLVFVLSFVYLVAALRRMFGQSWGRSFGKGLAIAVMYTVTIMVTLTGVTLWAFLRA